MFNLNTEKYGFRKFFRELSKPSKVILALTAPVIISLFSGAVFLRFYLFCHGFCNTGYILSEELVKCCGDCLGAVAVLVFFMEIFIKYD